MNNDLWQRRGPLSSDFLMCYVHAMLGLWSLVSYLFLHWSFTRSILSSLLGDFVRIGSLHNLGEYSILDFGLWHTDGRM